MFQMATKYRGRYWKRHEATPREETRKLILNLASSLDRTARDHCKTALSQAKALIKQLESAL